MEPKWCGEIRGIDEQGVSKGAEGRGGIHDKPEGIPELSAKPHGRLLCHFKMACFSTQLSEVILSFNIC